MTSDEELLWQTKLAARLHDPVEKALVLMRTAEGHERGTSARLRERLGLTSLAPEVHAAVRRADHWASAADRAAFPNRNEDGRYPAWQAVRFHEDPVLIHPLTGEPLALEGRLGEISPDAAKALAEDHFSGLVHEDALDRTALAFWRFGPEIDADDVKSLWALLPADSRVPDHTIFDHLDLTAALAGCFALDPEGGPALMAVTLGPVQPFIAAARSTSDLWAGSHLLSRMSWEAIRVVCDALGPEAVLFPRLRGVPQVDLWLYRSRGLRRALFQGCPWTWRESDANPLFAAALPNRFTALVPAREARAIAERVTDHVRGWVRERAEAAYRMLLDVAGAQDGAELPGFQQLRDQLEGFPEVHWASVPWSLADANGDRVDGSTPGLAAAMQPFFAARPPGYLGTEAWNLLSKGLMLEEGWFWHPNPGALYPALHELLERVLAASKSARTFDQFEQVGWRDSLNGDAEWLTDNREHLHLSPGQRTDTLWARVAERRPGWARPGEHLSALNALKRLWPTLFVEELREDLDLDVSRFVVSTHTMAVATSLTRTVGGQGRVPESLAEQVAVSSRDRVPLPRKLAESLRGHPDEATLRALPAWLEAMRESVSESDQHAADRTMRDLLGHPPEAYYALLLMDGDHMGRWLSADRDLTLPHERSFHPQIRAGLQAFRHDPAFIRYAREPRGPSPSRHMAISEALNHFSLTLAPDIVERQYHGRLLYAGGDDLMAMLPVIDVLPAMALLRAAYSGAEPQAIGVDLPAGFERQGNGFVRHEGRLMRLMGENATASCGVVVAHHQAPLGSVLRELRAAEQRAKSEGGRNAFSIGIVKRSGGAVQVTARWGEPLRLLIRLRALLAEPDVSRRAVYNSAQWLRDLPEPEGDGTLVARLLAYQLARQTGRRTTRERHDLPGLSRQLVTVAMAAAPAGSRLPWLVGFLSTAEFLARQSRNPESPAAKRAQEATA